MKIPSFIILPSARDAPQTAKSLVKHTLSKEVQKRPKHYHNDADYDPVTKPSTITTSRGFRVE